MRLKRLAFLAAMCCCGTAMTAAHSTAAGEAGVIQVGYCDCGEAVCGCEPVADCCGGCGEAVCGCEPVAACDSGCCDSGCDSGCAAGSCLTGCCSLKGCMKCDLGDPCSILGECGPYSAGGWVQMGYFNKANTLFNSYQDNFQLQQAWLWAEKSLDTSCGCDWGGRVDYLYGTDSQDTQAFGTKPRGWDNGWDNGADYGFAMPQLYGEVGYGDLSVKVGHFYTTIGYEVVQATGNFLYSHAYTMYNSEPFTHTGALATYNLSEHVTLYGGWTMGWDSGFDDNGDNFLGGVSLNVTDDLTVTYMVAAGRFGEDRFSNRVGAEQGYMSSLLIDYSMSDKLTYIFQNDILDTENNTGGTVRDTFDINQYLIYQLNDCWGVGARFEWYQNEGVYTNVGQQADIYALTLGLNYKPHANVMVRPEIRWYWVDNNAAVLAAGNTVTQDGTDDQTTFGVDTIFTF
jgi:hypothetical protein